MILQGILESFLRQTSEPDLDMAQTLGFKIIMIKVLMKNVLR